MAVVVAAVTIAPTAVAMSTRGRFGVSESLVVDSPATILAASATLCVSLRHRITASKVTLGSGSGQSLLAHVVSMRVMNT